MNFFNLFQGFFDITGQSLAARHSSERERRRQRLAESLATKDIESRIELMEQWIDSQQQLRESSRKLRRSGKTRDFNHSMNLTLQAVARDEIYVLKNMWEVIENEDVEIRPVKNDARQLTHAR